MVHGTGCAASSGLASFRHMHPEWLNADRTGYGSDTFAPSVGRTGPPKLLPARSSEERSHGELSYSDGRVRRFGLVRWPTDGVHEALARCRSRPASRITHQDMREDRS